MSKRKRLGMDKDFSRNVRGGFRKQINSTSKTGSFRENSNLARTMSTKFKRS